MYRIWKKFRFSASHQLAGLPDDHQCSRLHGHNYLIEVELSSETLDATGFVIDFGELKAIKKVIDEVYDHRHLNDIFDFNPTAENMAKAMYDSWKIGYPQITAVRVQETETSWGEYRQ
jgi:6-pyruvoyltetrahydropterin/6-carboxytetrahydropterin synthase